MGNVAIFKGKLVKFLAKAGILLPARTEAERSASPTSGEMAFNTSASKLEIYNGSIWVQFDNAAPIDPIDVAGIPPSLDLDFSGELPPTVTFTRNSTATYFGQDGYLKTANINVPRIEYDPITRDVKGLLNEESRQNILTYTENFDNNSWLKTRSSIGLNAEVAPDGTMTADKLIEDTQTGGHYVYANDITISPNTTYTFSCYVKAGERTWTYVQILNGSGTSGYSTYVNLSNGSFGAAVTAGSPTATDRKIEFVGNGWYRVSVTANVGAFTTGDFAVWTSTSDGGAGYTGDGKSGIYVWGAQVEAAAFSTSYIPSVQTFTSRNDGGVPKATYFDSTGILKTAADGAARITYNPSPDKLHFTPKLLLEPAATNLFLQSENLAASWSFARATQSSSIQATPDGNTNSKAIVLTNNGTAGGTYATQAYTTTAGIAFTISSFVKIPTSGTAFNGVAKIVDYADATVVDFNLITKNISLSSGTTFVSGSLQELPNGWFRISATFLPTTSSSHNISPYTFSSTGNLDSMWCWGAQLETGYATTSYIATTTTTITRNADIYTSASVTRQADSALMTGSNFTGWYAFDEGTIYCESDKFYAAKDQVIWSISDGVVGNTNEIRCYGASDGISVRPTSAFVNGVSQGATYLAVSPLTMSKYVSSFKLNDYAGTVNGATPVTNNVGLVPTLVNRLIIGNQEGNFVLNGHIKRLIFWPKRLSNDRLQLMTK